MIIDETGIANLNAKTAIASQLLSPTLDEKLMACRNFPVPCGGWNVCALHTPAIKRIGKMRTAATIEYPDERESEQQLQSSSYYS